MTDKKIIEAATGGLNRRGFLKGSAALGGGTLLANMPITRAVYAQGSKGGVLRVRSYGDLDTLDPGFYENAFNVDVMNCIYSKLVHYKPGREWGWELQAAESIEQVDDTRIRFKLRKGIMFTGGYGEMTAEDVKFSFERPLQFDSPVKGDWGPLEGVEVEDTYTGVIVFKEPFPPVWNITLPYGCGHIVSKKAVMEKTGDGGDFSLEPPCFSGPYILEEWKPDQYTKLVRNPDYTGPDEVAFDEIRVIPMDDEKSAEIAYEAGDIDYTGISLASLNNYRGNVPDNTTIREHPSLYYAWIGLNLDHPKLQNAKLREGIQWAINVNQILDAAYFGEAKPSTGIIAPGLVGHREQSLIPPEGDPEKARQLIAEAGAEGMSLTIDTQNSSKWKTIAEVAQAQLTQVGLNVEIGLHDSGAFWTIGMEDEGDRWKDVQLIVNRFSMVPDPYYATQWFTCEQVGIWNWERFCSEEFDQLHQKAVATTDSAERDRLYKKMQDLMERSGAYRFLTHEGSPVMYRDTVLAPATRPDGRPLYRYFDKA